MSLVIAFILLYGFGMPWWTYPAAVVAWGVSLWLKALAAPSEFPQM